MEFSIVAEIGIIEEVCKTFLLLCDLLTRGWKFVNQKFCDWDFQIPDVSDNHPLLTASDLNPRLKRFELVFICLNGPQSQTRKTIVIQ